MLFTGEDERQLMQRALEDWNASRIVATFSSGGDSGGIEQVAIERPDGSVEELTFAFEMPVDPDTGLPTCAISPEQWSANWLISFLEDLLSSHYGSLDSFLYASGALIIAKREDGMVIAELEEAAYGAYDEEKDDADEGDEPDISTSSLSVSCPAGHS